MASFQEIEAQVRQGQSVLDALRIQALVNISKITGRNAIAYYSAFMTRRGDGMEINDMDLNGFMNVVCKMDRKHGLDLILHTPGGGITATERIVGYLRDLFNGDIRCIVPQMAMSALYCSPEARISAHRCISAPNRGMALWKKSTSVQNGMFPII